ncbi:OTU domain-containing protein, partial [Actinoallomurus soli]|uniref:OTU domain-containing protein n=1 Tax=Actinoallomurus soli TaxID=2952535 RepID=UPI0020935CC0
MRTRLADALRDTPAYRDRLRDQARQFLAEDHATGLGHQRGTRAWNQAVNTHLAAYPEPDWAQIITDLRTPGSWDNAAGDIAPHVAAWVFNLTITVHGPYNTRYQIGDPGGTPIDLWRNGTHWERLIDQDVLIGGAPTSPAGHQQPAGMGSDIGPAARSRESSPARPADEDAPTAGVVLRWRSSGFSRGVGYNAPIIQLGRDYGRGNDEGWTRWFIHRPAGAQTQPSESDDRMDLDVPGPANRQALDTPAPPARAGTDVPATTGGAGWAPQRRFLTPGVDRLDRRDLNVLAWEARDAGVANRTEFMSALTQAGWRFEPIDAAFEWARPGVTPADYELDLQQARQLLQDGPTRGYRRSSLNRFPSFRGVPADELLAQLGPDYAIETDGHGFPWFVYRPAEAQRAPGTGADVYMALTGDAMAAGLRASISDRQAQIAADLREQMGGEVDPVVLQAACDRDPQLRVLRDALASWSSGPTAAGTGTGADGGLEGRIDGAVAAAAVWARQADQGRPEGPVVATGEWRSRYCWLFLTGLARRLSAALPDPVAALHGPRFTAWDQVTGVLAGADPGTSVYVALGNLRRLGHGIWIAHLGGRLLRLVDPDQNAANGGYTSVVGTEEQVLAYLTGVSDESDWLGEGRVGSREGLPLIDAHAHFRGPNGQDIDLLPSAGPESGSAAQAVTDRTFRSGIGMPRPTRTDEERWDRLHQAVAATARVGLTVSKAERTWGQSGGGGATEAAKAAVNNQEQLNAHGLTRHGDRVYLPEHAPTGPEPTPPAPRPRARDDEERWARLYQAVAATAGEGLTVSKAERTWGQSGGGGASEAAKAAVNDREQLNAHGLARHGDRVYLTGHVPDRLEPTPRAPRAPRARDDEARWTRLHQAVAATAGEGLPVTRAAEKWGQSRDGGASEAAKAAVNDREQLNAHGLERHGNRVYLTGHAPTGLEPIPRAPRARDDEARWTRLRQAVAATAGEGLPVSTAAQKWGQSYGVGVTAAAKAAVNDQEQLNAHGLTRHGNR